jgi:hypothetical protein
MILIGVPDLEIVVSYNDTKNLVTGTSPRHIQEPHPRTNLEEYNI